MTRRSVVKAFRPAVAVLARFYLNFVGSLAVLAVIPFLFGWQSTVVMSASMEPGIRAGDVLAAQPLTTGDLESGLVVPGHVLLAESPMKPGTLFTHRVVTAEQDGSFVTKGDNNGSLDPAPLPSGNVKGLERLRVPFIGLPVQALHERNFGPVLLFVASISLAGLTCLADRGPAASADTRAQATRARRRKRSALTLTAMLGVTAATLAAVLALQGSAAAFTGFTAPPRSSWAAAATFGSATTNVATCNGAKYTVSVTAATITCTIVSPGTGSVTHDLTIQGTGANTKWTVTADWSGVTKFKSATLTNYGYPAVSNIPGPTYVVNPQNLCSGSPQPDVPTSTCNFTWIGSTLPARTPRLIIYLNP
jgi:signal peptidase